MDEAHDAADAAVAAFQREVAQVYESAANEAQDALSEFLRRFADDDEHMRQLLEDGAITKREYRSWRSSKMLAGKRYRALLAQMAAMLSDADEQAAMMLRGYLPQVAADNANFAAAQIDSSVGMETAFALQDADTIRVMLAEHGAYIYEPEVDKRKDMAWNRRQLANAITKGVLMGDSIPKIAARVQDVAASDRAWATRTARTAVTAAENAGRAASYARAEQMGIKLRQEWVATIDGRTRHSHRMLDGERIEVGGVFSNGCRYPGDPSAPYVETANCRCTMVAVVEGYEQDEDRWAKLESSATYDQWKSSKPITKAQQDRLVSDGVVVRKLLTTHSKKKAPDTSKWASLFNRKLRNEAWDRSLTALERQHFTSYCGGIFDEVEGQSYSYSDLNSYLRYGKWNFRKEIGEDAFAKAAGSQASQMVEALKRNELTEDLVVRRWTGSSFLDDIKEGDESQFIGFTSTTTKKSLKGSGSTLDTSKFVVDIFIPKGSRVGAYVSSVAGNTGESEFLIAHGVRFRVVKKTKKKAWLEIID